MMTSNVLRTALLMLLFMPGLAAAAVGLPFLQPKPTCDPSISTCAPGTAPTKCEAINCLASLEEQAKFEKENNCKFGTDNLCGGKPVDKATECCGKDSRTGKPKVVDKVMTKKGVITDGADSFTWENYQRMCPDRKQNNAPPNELWQTCEKDKKHSPDDDYEIEEVRPNGAARPYCIEGCSIPPAAVATAYGTGIFLFPNRNNPAGYETGRSAERTAASSFYKPCVAHDICYQTCKDDQKTCDTKLKSDSIAACRTIPAEHETPVPAPPPALVSFKNTRYECEKAAGRMFDVLSGFKFGAPAFNLRRQQYCQCC